MSKTLNIFGTTYTMSGANKGIKYVNESGVQYPLNALIINDNNIDLRYYTLSISYEYTTGGIAAQPYAASLISGDTYNVSSPIIEGATPDIIIVSGVLSSDTSIVVKYAIALILLYIEGSVTFHEEATICCADLVPWSDIYIHLVSDYGLSTLSSVCNIQLVINQSMAATDTYELNCSANLSANVSIELTGAALGSLHSVANITLDVIQSLVAQLDAYIFGSAATCALKHTLDLHGITHSALHGTGYLANYNNVDLAGTMHSNIDATGTLVCLLGMLEMSAHAASSISQEADLVTLSIISSSATATSTLGTIASITLSYDIYVKMAGRTHTALTGSATGSLVRLPTSTNGVLHIYEVDSATQTDDVLKFS